MTITINELGIASMVTLIICIAIIIIAIICISFRCRAKKRRQLAGLLETNKQPNLTVTHEEKKIAPVQKRKIHWNASNSPGVVGYKLYWVVGKGVNYDSDSAEVGNVTEVILPDAVPSFPVVGDKIELGVVAVDRIGNESDMIKLYGPLGFNAPDAPTGLTVETI
jgi:hypothetical protein